MLLAVEAVSVLLVEVVGLVVELRQGKIARSGLRTLIPVLM